MGGDTLTSTARCFPAYVAPTGVLTVREEYGRNSIAFSLRNVDNLSVKKMKSSRLVVWSRMIVKMPWMHKVESG